MKFTVELATVDNRRQVAMRSDLQSDYARHRHGFAPHEFRRAIGWSG